MADVFRRPCASGGRTAPPAPSAGTQAAEGASEGAPLPQSVSVASGVTSEAAARAAEQQRQAGNAASAASSSAGAGSHQGSFQDLVRDSRRLQRRLRAPRAVWDNGRRLPRKGANAKAEHGTSGTSLRGSKRSSSASELVEAGSLSISQPDAKRGERCTSAEMCTHALPATCSCCTLAAALRDGLDTTLAGIPLPANCQGWQD